MIYCRLVPNAAVKVHPAAPMALASQGLEAKTVRDAEEELRLLESSRLT